MKDSNGKKERIMKKLLLILSAMLLMQAAAVSVSAQSNLGNWEDYETLDSREFRDIAERSKNKGLLDISVNTTDPGFYKNIRISDNTIVPESAPVKDGPKAGDTISGVVYNDEWPMMMVIVSEMDSMYRVVSHGVTDYNGNFSFKLVNPNDRIVVNWPGYQRVDTIIDRLHYDFMLKEYDDIPEAIITPYRQETK